MATPPDGILKAQRTPTHSPTPSPGNTLEDYVSTLHNPDSISELILSIEALRTGSPPPPDSPEARALQALAAHSGLSLQDDAHLRQAIVALGDRARALSELGRETGAIEAETLALALLKAADGTRQRLGPGPGLEAALHERVTSLLLAYRSAKGDAPRSDTWWAELEDSAHRRLVPAFARLAPKLSELENSPLRGALLNSPLLMAVLFALPGLITIPLPLSTPLTLILLGLFGAFVIHPAWVSRLRGQVGAIGESLAQEGPRLARISGEARVDESNFELGQVLDDLMPILEGERLAGRMEPESMAPGVEDYFEEITPLFEELSERNPVYLQNLKDLALGPLLRQYGTWAKARTWVEAHWLGGILDVPRRLALSLGLLGLPLAYLAARISPLPQIVDIPLMVGMFAALGYGLSSALPGTLPSRRKLIEGLKAKQGELDGVS